MGYGEDGMWDWGAQEREDRKKALRERNERLTMQERDRIEKQKVESARRAKIRDGVMMLREFQNAGVEPLALDPDGHPIISLGALRCIGWTIEDGENGKVLVKPKKEKRPSRKALG